MTIIEYEDRIKDIVNKENHDDFIFEFLSVYEKIAKSTITKLRNGTNNLAKNPGEVYLKNKLFFKKTSNDLISEYSQIENYVKNIKSKPRYIIVTNFKKLLAKDTLTKDSLDIEFKQLPKYFEFFLAWNGIEKADFEKENPADIKAAEYFARIYDQLLDDNREVSRHGFNLFLIRLLFCLFAEDTGIFKDNAFTDFLKMMTSEDGSDMNDRISELFQFLDKKDRTGNEPAYLLEFPYVNGQLFTSAHERIKFTKKTRKSIIDAGELIGWSKVNPDILGSMIQAVASKNKRSHLGMHYTSVSIIMKTIKPLFLDDLRNEFEKAKGNNDKLNRLLVRISKIKFMDPACGSGNFLIIAYKELRRLEMDILSEQRKLNASTMYIPNIDLSQFYGIEIDDFACDVTRLSLWIADHQMNRELQERFNDIVRPTLPLHKSGEVKCGNSLRIDWKKIMSPDGEYYVFGNPPYKGAKWQNDDQKDDLKHALDNNSKYKKLDYVSGWLFKGAKYIYDGDGSLGFVTTNSVTQGEQVSMIWPKILKYAQISYAYQSTKWKNNAKANAGVSVDIIGLKPKNDSDYEKKLFSGNKVTKPANISPYLFEGNNMCIEALNKPINNLPKMVIGSMPRDNGNLIFDDNEKIKLLNEGVDSTIIRKYIGSSEFIKNTYRYCLWMNKEQYLKQTSPLLQEMVNDNRKYRESRKAKSTNEAAKTPWRFVQKGEYEKAYGDKSNLNKISIIVPRVTSENRLYAPIGIVNSDDIISDSAMAVYDAPIWLMGLLQSRMHMVWLKSFGGKLENRLRYSASLVYNTFPIPEISTRKKNEIEKLTLKILDIRDEEGGSLSELYGSPLSKNNPKPMNERLRNAHNKLDKSVDRLYKSREITNDDERLSLLLDMYSKKIKGEN